MTMNVHGHGLCPIKICLADDWINDKKLHPNFESLGLPA